MTDPRDKRITELEDALRKLIREGDFLSLSPKQREKWHAAANDAENVISGQKQVPSGYAVLPLEATVDMFMRGGGVAISNCGKDGMGRRGRIGDIAARDAWAEMAKIAIKNRNETSNGYR